MKINGLDLQKLKIIVLGNKIDLNQRVILI